MGYEQAKIVQDYQTLASIVSQALGGGGSRPASASAPRSGDNVMHPKNAAEMQAAFKAVFGHG